MYGITRRKVRPDDEDSFERTKKFEDDGAGQILTVTNAFGVYQIKPKPLKILISIGIQRNLYQRYP